MALLKKYTARGIDDVFSTIVNFLTSDPGTPGKDWVIHADHRLLSNPYTYKRVVLKNTGKSNNENIYIGIYGVIESAGFNSGIILKTYYQYDNSIISGQFATHFFNNTYGNKGGAYNTRNFMPMRDDASSSNKPPVDLWVYSNKSRIIIVLNSDEKYSNGYAGQYIRYVTPQEVPYPLACFTDSFNGGNSGDINISEALWNTWLGHATVDWDSGYEGNRHRRNLLFAQHGGWTNNPSSTRHFGCNSVMTPTGWGTDWCMDPTAFNRSSDILTGPPVNYPDGGTEILLFPLTLYHYTPGFTDYIVLGQLDGVYWAPNIANTIQAEVGSPDCILFPDINRTEWYSWMAIKDVL